MPCTNFLKRLVNYIKSISQQSKSWVLQGYPLAYLGSFRLSTGTKRVEDGRIPSEMSTYVCVC